MAYETIKVRVEAEKVGIITLNRPKQLNALNADLMIELGKALKASTSKIEAALPVGLTLRQVQDQPRAVSQSVDQASTSTSLASDVNPSVHGESVTFTATVSVTAPGSGTATGTVEFFDGATSLGSAAVDGTGTATVSTSTGRSAIARRSWASASGNLPGRATTRPRLLSQREHVGSTSTARRGST